MGHSLFLIGSIARKDNNKKSDIDYVCIYDNEKPNVLLSDGGNISFYSVDKFQWLINNSKLFVKHVEIDGIEIYAEPHHRKLIKNFKLNESILKFDLEEFLQSAKNLTWIPSDDRGVIWACDYVYTIARNIVYINNALNGIFCFSYEKAINYFLQTNSTPELINMFLLLREGKYFFRANDKNSKENEINTFLLESILQVLTGKQCHIIIGGTSNLPQLKKNSYEYFRLIERAIINNEITDNGFLEKLKNHGEYFFAIRKLADSLITHP